MSLTDLNPLSQDPKIEINQISNREYILAPTVQSGKDRECTTADFNTTDQNPISIDIGKLGTGTWVIHPGSDKQYIITNFSKEKVSKANLKPKINSTLELMYKARHPYLLRLWTHFENNTNLFLVFEDFEGEWLDNKISTVDLDTNTCLLYFEEIIIAVQHWHNFNMCNINVTPETILVGDFVKLTDYGLKWSGRNMKPRRQTMHCKIGNVSYSMSVYTSPEEFLALKNRTRPVWTNKTDSWNWGIWLFEMVTKFKSPFKCGSWDELGDAILNRDIDVSCIKDKIIRDLIIGLTQKNPEDRYDIEEILNMEVIKNTEIEFPESDEDDDIIHGGESEGNEEDNLNFEEDWMNDIQWKTENSKMYSTLGLSGDLNNIAPNSFSTAHWREASQMSFIKGHKDKHGTDGNYNDEEGNVSCIVKNDDDEFEDGSEDGYEDDEEEEEEDEEQEEEEGEEEGENGGSSNEDNYFEENEEEDNMKIRELQVKYKEWQSELKKERNEIRKNEEYIQKWKLEKQEYEKKIKLEELNSSKTAGKEGENIKFDVHGFMEDTQTAMKQFQNSKTIFRDLAEKLIEELNEAYIKLTQESNDYLNGKTNAFDTTLSAMKKEAQGFAVDSTQNKNENPEIIALMKEISELQGQKKAQLEKENIVERLKRKMMILEKTGSDNKELTLTLTSIENKKAQLLEKEKNDYLNIDSKLGDVLNFAKHNCNDKAFEEFTSKK